MAAAGMTLQILDFLPVGSKLKATRRHEDRYPLRRKLTGEDPADP